MSYEPSPNRRVEPRYRIPLGGVLLAVIAATLFTLPAPALSKTRVTVAVGDLAILEGDAGKTVAKLPISADWDDDSDKGKSIWIGWTTKQDTARAGRDYAPTRGTLILFPGQTSASLEVAIFGDLDDELDEAFYVQLDDTKDVKFTNRWGTVTILDDDEPELKIGDLTLREGDSGTTAAIFKVGLSAPASVPVTVSYSSVDGTATSTDGDYQSASGSVTLNPGEMTVPITILINGDTTVEPDEALLVRLSNVVNAVVLDGEGRATIINDDGPAEISVDSPSIVEGNAGTSQLTFRLSLAPPSASTVRIDFATADATATAGTDYDAKRGTLSFAPGTDTATVVIAVHGDAAVEPDEAFELRLSNPQGAVLRNNTGQGTIVNDDGSVLISIGERTVVEGDSGSTDASVTVTLSAPSSQPVSVDYETLDDTATAVDSDYQSTSATLSFAPGETSKLIPIKVYGDLTSEADESFLVELSRPLNAAIASSMGKVTILNDDKPSLSITDAVVKEGNSGTMAATFVVTLDTTSDRPITVSYTSADGSATLTDNDYQSTAGSVTLNPGELTVPITVLVNGDAVVEPDEDFIVLLSGATNATVTNADGRATIQNDDGPARLTIGDVAVVEGDSGQSTADFTLSLSPPSSQIVAVSYATENGTATAGDDYRSLGGTATFQPGETAVTVAVTIDSDTTVEPDEAFFLRLSNPLGAELADDSGKATIVNDDGSIQISISDRTVVEGEDGTTDASLDVTLSAPSTETVTVRYTTVDGTATLADGDYAPAAGTLNFAPGETRSILGIEVYGDTTPEDDESFQVQLYGAVAAAIGDHLGEITIQSDDTAPEALLSIGDASLLEGDIGSIDAIFTVSLSRESADPVEVVVTTMDSTAKAADNDYEPLSTRLWFDPGVTVQSVRVLVLGDTKIEDDEVFHVVLSAPVNAQLDHDRGEGTIVDDDGRDSPPPTSTPSVSINDIRMPEGDIGSVDAVFRVLLDQPSPEAVTVAYETNDGTATVADRDYRPSSGIIKFDPGQIEATVAVQIIGDTGAEPDETFTVALSNPVGATLANASGRGTIDNDDDGGGELTLRGGRSIKEDGHHAVVLVERSGSAFEAAHVTVSTESDTAIAGQDFEPLSQIVSWNAGEAGTRRLKVPILDDRRVEGTERFTVRLSEPSKGATVHGAGAIEIAIVDNDSASSIIGGGDLIADAGAIVPLEVRVVDQNDEPVEGAVVDWQSDRGAELLDGDATISDSDGFARQQVQLPSIPTVVTVEAALRETDESVSFRIAVQGELTELFDPETSPNEAQVANTLDRSCILAQGEFRAGCNYVFALDESSEQRQAVTALTPLEAATQGTTATESMKVQNRNIETRMQALRGRGTSSMADQLTIDVRGQSIQVGQLASAISTDNRTERQRLDAEVDHALADLTGQLSQSENGATVPNDLIADELPRFGLFVNGRASFGDAPTTDLENGYDFDTLGLTLGGDYRLNDRFFIGLAVGLLDNQVDFDRDGGTLDTSGLSLSLYSSYQLQNFYVDATATLGALDYDQVRNIDLPKPFAGQDRLEARSSTEGDQVSLHLGVGYDATLGGSNLGGFARINYTDVEIDGYAETGAGAFNLGFDPQLVDSLLAEAGLEFSFAKSYGWGVLIPLVRFSYFHEFEDDVRNVDGFFLEDTTRNRFNLLSNPPDRDYFNLGLGLNLTLKRLRSLYILFDTDLERDDLDLYTTQIGFRQQM